MKKEITKEEAKQKLQDEAKKITEEDLKKVIDKADEIKEKFEGKGPLGRFISDVKLMISLIKDYYDGKYRKIPFYSIAAIIAALLYVFNPFDIIPDAIPGGWSGRWCSRCRSLFTFGRTRFNGV